MTDRIRINTGNLGRTREQVSSHIRQIKEQVAAMYGDISSLGTMWEGEAHSTFDSEFRKDVGRLENLCGDLDGIVSYEDHAIAEYERCEKDAARLIDAVRV